MTKIEETDVKKEAKRFRPPNFSDKDLELLLKLTNERVHILENKKQGATCTQQKNIAWTEIGDAFNACAEYVRLVQWQ